MRNVCEVTAETKMANKRTIYLDMQEQIKLDVQSVNSPFSAASQILIVVGVWKFPFKCLFGSHMYVYIHRLLLGLLLVLPAFYKIYTKAQTCTREPNDNLYM